MSIERINVPLSADEAHALIQLAETEHRHPREQARLIIWKELNRRGLLANEPKREAKGAKTC